MASVLYCSNSWLPPIGGKLKCLDVSYHEAVITIVRIPYTFGSWLMSNLFFFHAFSIFILTEDIWIRINCCIIGLINLHEVTGRKVELNWSHLAYELPSKTRYWMKDGRIDLVMGRQGRRRKQILDDRKETRGYWKLKRESARCNVWRTAFGRGCAPVRNTDCERNDTWLLLLVRGTVFITNCVYNTRFCLLCVP
jgi:hypothetical protein